MRRITAIIIGAVLAGLALAGGPAAEAGGGCHDDKLNDARGVAVVLDKACFQPTVIRLDAGQQVTWTNKDPEAHTVTGVANSWGSYKELGQGDTVSYQFDKSGVFPYFCFLHPSMVGAVVVGDGTAAGTSTAADGGVKAVSAQAPGGDQSAAGSSAAVEDDSGSNNAVPIAIGVGVLAALAGFAAAFVLRRKAGQA